MRLQFLARMGSHQCSSPIQLGIEFLELLEHDLHFLPVGRAHCEEVETL